MKSVKNSEEGPFLAKVEWTKHAPTSFSRGNKTRGTITMTQKDVDAPVKFHVKLKHVRPVSKRPTLHGFHIHENPVVNQHDLEKTCNTCGGHFNPTNCNHGSRFVEGKERHVGDLVNNICIDKNGEIDLVFYDELCTLVPNPPYRDYSIIGKSIVIHEGIDDLGLEGRMEPVPFLQSEVVEEPLVKRKSKSFKKTMAKRIRTFMDAMFTKKGARSGIRYYKDEEKQKSSLVNGNAGGRIACGNIVRIV